MAGYDWFISAVNRINGYDKDLHRKIIYIIYNDNIIEGFVLNTTRRIVTVKFKDEDGVYKRMNVAYNNKHHTWFVNKDVATAKLKKMTKNEEVGK